VVLFSFPEVVGLVGGFLKDETVYKAMDEYRVTTD